MSAIATLGRGIAEWLTPTIGIKMALGIIKPRKRHEDAAWTNTQGCDASMDYEADPVNEHEARWLDLIQEAINRAQEIVEVDALLNRVKLARVRYPGLKSAAEYAKMEINQMHPAVAVELVCLLKGENAKI